MFHKILASLQEQNLQYFICTYPSDLFPWGKKKKLDTDLISPNYTLTVNNWSVLMAAKLYILLKKYVAGFVLILTNYSLYFDSYFLFYNNLFNTTELNLEVHSIKCLRTQTCWMKSAHFFCFISN